MIARNILTSFAFFSLCDRTPFVIEFDPISAAASPPLFFVFVPLGSRLYLFRINFMFSSLQTNHALDVNHAVSPSPALDTGGKLPRQACCFVAFVLLFFCNFDFCAITDCRSATGEFVYTSALREWLNECRNGAPASGPFTRHFYRLCSLWFRAIPKIPVLPITPIIPKGRSETEEKPTTSQTTATGTYTQAASRFSHGTGDSGP